MRIIGHMGFWGLSLILCGGLMAEQVSQHWVTIKDKERGLQADFPHPPLEMTFEIPFQNTPPKGHIHLYSVPTQTGIFVASTFSSPEVSADHLQKEQFSEFFESLLVPYFFFNPAVFQDHQTFNHQFLGDQEDAISFQISYHDHGIVKNLEGRAIVKDNILYTYFYLASEKVFDPDLFKRFIDSVQVTKGSTS